MFDVEMLRFQLRMISADSTAEHFIHLCQENYSLNTEVIIIF